MESKKELKSKEDQTEVCDWIRGELMEMTARNKNYFGDTLSLFFTMYSDFEDRTNI